MKKPQWLSHYDFGPVVEMPKSYHVYDFSKEKSSSTYIYSVGRYNEKRPQMYTTPLFKNQHRDIHMGIDLGVPKGSPVFNFYRGELIYKKNNQGEGDYGPTLVFRYKFESIYLYALYGHLSLSSLDLHSVGDVVERGGKIAFVGDQTVNGGWFPHVHFQLSLKDPQEADMAGVVASKDHKQALELYPDPRWVLGSIY